MAEHGGQDLWKIKPPKGQTPSDKSSRDRIPVNLAMKNGKRIVPWLSRPTGKLFDRVSLHRRGPLEGQTMENRTTKLDLGEPREDQVSWGGRGCYERAMRKTGPHPSLLPGTISVSNPPAISG